MSCEEALFWYAVVAITLRMPLFGENIGTERGRMAAYERNGATDWLYRASSGE